MFTIKGKYSEIKIYASIIEDEALSQLYQMANHPVTEGCNSDPPNLQLQKLRRLRG